MLWILVALVGVAIVVFGVVRLAEASSHGQSGTNALALAI